MFFLAPASNGRIVEKSANNRAYHLYCQDLKKFTHNPPICCRLSFRDEILLLVIPENAARCPLLRHGVHGGAGEADPRGQVPRPEAGPATVQGLLLHQQALHHHHRTAQLTIGDVVPSRLPTPLTNAYVLLTNAIFFPLCVKTFE